MSSTSLKARAGSPTLSHGRYRREIRRGEARIMAKKRAAEAETADNTANWEDFADELPDLPALLEEFREIGDRVKKDEARKKELAPGIEAAVIVGGKKSLACGGFRATRVEVEGRKSVSPERVVEKAVTFGLSPVQITELLEYSTVQAPGYSYPLVSRVEE